jgi:hypothetical protein
MNRAITSKDIQNKLRVEVSGEKDPVVSFQIHLFEVSTVVLRGASKFNI